MRAHENPFRVERVLRVRYWPQGESWEELIGRFEAMRRVCVLGEEGAGKTTFLEDLQARLEGRGYRTVLRLHAGERPRLDWGELGRLGERDVLLLDGADLLSRVEWWRVRWMSRRWGGLVAVSHRRVLLPVLVRCRTSAEILERILGELIPEETAEKRGEMARELFVRHGGNLREALRECYDDWAGR